ncbi:hypothetical protein TMO_c0402 (plasmid) [Tistrella mobilis KA081020-065]|uniref:Uncharacterized protein n=1 Tax=Tistrella mobilis (strain KA081020-065) TaxID=1110502 RepID=I3TW74_TISMK|nr:hypothetical protein TMO_c0402 [Tistrella mobilis KA081020-065]
MARVQPCHGMMAETLTNWSENAAGIGNDCIKIMRLPDSSSFCLFFAQILVMRIPRRRCNMLQQMIACRR